MSAIYAKLPSARETGTLRTAPTGRLFEVVTPEPGNRGGKSAPTALSSELALATNSFELEVLDLMAQTVETKIKEALGAERELEEELLAYVRVFFANKRRTRLR